LGLNSQAYAEHEEPDKDFCIVALDLIASLFQSLDDAIFPLIETTQPTLMDVLMQCSKAFAA
jgi:transportin-1